MSSLLPAPVHALFDAQHGVATAAQLAALGLSSGVQRRLRSEGVVRRHPDVGGALILIDHPAGSGLAACLGALCLTLPTVVVASSTAAALWNITPAQGTDAVVHLLAPPASHPVRAGWVQVYRCARLRDVDVVARSDGIRLTSPERTLADLARTQSPAEHRLVLDAAIRAGICDPRRLNDVARHLATPGRPWGRQLLRAIGVAPCAIGLPRTAGRSPVGGPQVV